MTQDDQMQPTIGNLQTQIEDLRRQIVSSRKTPGTEHGRLRRMRGGRALIAALVSVAGVLAVGGAAYASIPDAGGVIHACYSTSSGLLQVATSSTNTCHSGFTPISWSQIGPQGLQGLQGPAGVPGTNGTNGTNGADGATGSTGSQGPAGPSGISGYEIVTASTGGLNEGDAANVTCPAGKHALGGGGEITVDPFGEAFVKGSAPRLGGVGWEVEIGTHLTDAQIGALANGSDIDVTGSEISVQVWVICATTTS